MRINRIQSINFRINEYNINPVNEKQNQDYRISNSTEKYLDNLSRINTPAVIKNDNSQNKNFKYKNNLRSMIQNNQSVMMAIIPRTFTAEDLNGDDMITLSEGEKKGIKGGKKAVTDTASKLLYQ